MTPLFKKLNLKEGQTVYCFNAPDTFAPELDALAPDTKVIRDAARPEAVSFALVFATKQAEVDHYADLLAPQLQGDAVLWFCYPKGTSKRFRCEFNRDNGWAALGRHDLEGVRMVAIDEDWSALRFRRLQYIKTLTRSERNATSAAGKDRVRAARKA